MKIKNLKIKSKNKLIQLQILKSKLYKKEFSIKLKKNFNHVTIKFYFKKIINLIYEYHVNNKKILFFNFPKKITKSINSLLKSNQTKHLAIQNESLLTKYSKNDFDLILFFNLTTNCLDSLNKIYYFNIPVIFINSDFNTLNLKQDYIIPGNFKVLEKQITNNLLLCILKAIFKRAQIKKSFKFFKFKLIKLKNKKNYNFK